MSRVDGDLVRCFGGKVCATFHDAWFYNCYYHMRQFKREVLRDGLVSDVLINRGKPMFLARIEYDLCYAAAFARAALCITFAMEIENEG